MGTSVGWHGVVSGHAFGVPSGQHKPGRAVHVWVGWANGQLDAQQLQVWVPVVGSSWRYLTSGIGDHASKHVLPCLQCSLSTLWSCSLRAQLQLKACKLGRLVII